MRTSECKIKICKWKENQFSISRPSKMTSCASSVSTFGSAFFFLPLVCYFHPRSAIKIIFIFMSEVGYRVNDPNWWHLVDKLFPFYCARPHRNPKSLPRERHQWTRISVENWSIIYFGGLIGPWTRELLILPPFSIRPALLPRVGLIWLRWIRQSNPKRFIDRDLTR